MFLRSEKESPGVLEHRRCPQYCVIIPSFICSCNNVHVPLCVKSTPRPDVHRLPQMSPNLSDGVSVNQLSRNTSDLRLVFFIKYINIYTVPSLLPSFLPLFCLSLPPSFHLPSFNSSSRFILSSYPPSSH